MKKILAIALAMTLTMGTLAGCGSTEEVSSIPASADSASTSTPSTTEEKVLNIFTWDGYFPPNVLEDCTTET